MTLKTITLPAKPIPIIAETDVLVVGSGPGGLAAAISCARAGVETMLIDRYGWRWLTRLKRNRLVNPDRCGNRALSEIDIGAQGRIVHLKGYGMIRVFKIVAPDGDIDYWATNDLAVNEWQRLKWADCEWSIEEYHRGLKQCCGVGRAQVRSSRAQRNHIGFAIRAFLRLEMHWFTTGVSWLID